MLNENQIAPREIHSGQEEWAELNEEAKGLSNEVEFEFISQRPKNDFPPFTHGQEGEEEKVEQIME